ncbi:MAG TPA: NAD(P)H-binding protein [Desulfuromonadales bacterium]|nr:NAD(P)H-binding protein [Desulfuromonadales bacterium]
MGAAMAKAELDVVTGAFSFTGKYIARRLLALGRQVKTLTGHPGREHPFGNAVTAMPFQFEDPEALRDGLAGANTLYNTYWVRFEHGRMTFARAVDHTAALLAAARQAGVRRVVHISVAHADEASPYPYFRAKGEAERLVRESGLSYAILRPTVLFGTEGILFNNLAYMLRRFPAFAIPGKGDYRLQPIHVDDLAELAVNAGHEERSLVLDAAGPETFTFDELVRLMAKQVGSHARLLHMSPERALKLIRMVGGLVGDVVLTREEIDGLMRDMLALPGRPVGHTLFSSWVGQNAATLGSSYFPEMVRHYK